MNAIDFLRQFRIGEFAVFDLAVAFLGVFLLAPFLSRLFRKIGLDIPRKSWLLWTLPIGIATHLILGRITPLTRDFLDPQGHYLSKIIIIGLVVWGAWGVKKVSNQKL
jgi:hypothetical protein